MNNNCLGKSQIGLSTFLASSHPTDKCGTNGLPVTPNSIHIYGRFQELKLLSHTNLCQYIEIVRGKNERLVIVSEHYENTLSQNIESKRINDIDTLQKLCREIMSGLDYLHYHGYVHRHLSCRNILLDHNHTVKLSKYGLYHMTAYCDCVAFPIAGLFYASPEVINSGIGYNVTLGPSKSNVDIWSLGMVLLDCFLDGALWGSLRDSPSKITRFLVNLFSLKDNVNGFDEIIKVSNASSKIASVSNDFVSFITLCLTIDPGKRPSIRQLFSHSFVCHIPTRISNFEFSKFPEIYRSEHLPHVDFNKLLLSAYANEGEDHLSNLSTRLVYHLWCLAGGDVFSELKKYHLIDSNTPILLLPFSHLNNGEEFGVENDQALTYNNTTVCVSLNQLRNRLSHIPPAAYYPLVIENNLFPTDTSEAAKLPLIIREKNVEYQFHRIVLFERLLKGYPHSRERLVKEARIDIPPFVRARVWAALLDITGDIFDEYNRIDKVSITVTDRQIEVDIPRCHQYNHLLASPTAHQKFKNVLKSWVVTQDKLVYWQGLDSLCAPFIYLNFNNEALAYSCLSAFIPKYLYNFFLKDNSAVIQEYLAVFAQLIAFHEPDLFNHLKDIGFMPELYAIPWFLTMFSHVFPLHKIYYLWDTLLLGNSMLPLCVGVSLLMQFKEQLLLFDFNECILLFSDMPGIDIERCMKDSIKLFNHTPPSAALRKHDNPLNSMKAPSEEAFMNLPEKDFAPLEQLKNETCIRISARDLVRISHLTSQSDDHIPALIIKEKTNKSKYSKKYKNDITKLNKVLTIDLRVSKEFIVSHLPNSVNIPFNLAVNDNNELVHSPLTSIVEAHKEQMILIMGPKGKRPIIFGQILVSKGYRRVCVMDGSASILKNLGYFKNSLNM